MKKKVSSVSYCVYGPDVPDTMSRKDGLRKLTRTTSQVDGKVARKKNREERLKAQRRERC